METSPQAAAAEGLEGLEEEGKEFQTSVKKLSDDTATALRRGQVISKISDVVRELVDNAIDAEATSIQVHLIKYGVDKIEVRDTGKGIPSSEVKKAVIGGHTSKLKNQSHLSCSSKQYGFRGEALSSICLSGKVTLVTKTVNEVQAMRYVLNNHGEIVTESPIARGQGTTVTVEKLFSHLPVRRQKAQEKATGVAELKEIESYMKSLAIVNPKIHMSLYHDSSLIWTKPSVPSIDQALLSVLGHNLAKHLTKCGPVDIEIEENERRKRTVELYLPKLPIDVDIVGMTNKKFSMIYVNRRRINHLSVFEKEIRKYVDAACQNSFSEKKKLPVFMLCITIPSDEADFNLDMDKSKIFMKNFEEIGKTITEILQKFYKIELTEGKNMVVKQPEIETLPSTCNHVVVPDLIPTSPIIGDNAPTSAHPEKRNANIQEFLESIADSSNNFTSPSKKETSTIFCSKNSNLEGCSKTLPNDSVSVIGNFEIVLEGVDMDSQEDIVDQKSADSDAHAKMQDWVYGRLLDKKGDIIQNVAVMNRPQPEKLVEDQSSVLASIKCITSPESTQKPNAFEKIGSGFSFRRPFSTTVPCKRPRLSEVLDNSSNIQSSPSPSGVSFSCDPRQITLDATWKLAANRTQDSSFVISTPTGTRLPMSFSCKASSSQWRQPISGSKSSSTVGIPPRSVLDFWRKSGKGAKKATSEQENSIIGCSNDVNPHSKAKIIGYIGSGYYASKIDDTVGIFSPMQMLRFFPSLKYDYEISLEKIHPKQTNIITLPNNSPEMSLFKVPLEKAEQLIEEFPKLVSVKSDIYGKIFNPSLESVSTFQKQLSVLKKVTCD